MKKKRIIHISNMGGGIEVDPVGGHKCDFECKEVSYEREA